jgi:hypothetical protein
MTQKIYPVRFGNLATVASVTGAPTIDTTSRPGKTIYKFLSSGSITNSDRIRGN